MSTRIGVQLSWWSIGDFIAKVLLFFAPKRWRLRIVENTEQKKVRVLRTSSTETKEGMTLVEGVFATLLFDLALFGTNNFFIKFIIKFFTNLQNSWETPFRNGEQAKHSILEFCHRLNIQCDPWIWDKPIGEYSCINDFFSRTYANEYFPSLGSADLVSPACCTMTRYNDDTDLKQILIKGCNYDINAIGLPTNDIISYSRNPIFIGYLSPSDYHRVHSPIHGKCIHLQLEGGEKRSASVKFFDGNFNILNDNRRLVAILESPLGVRVALVIVGGIGVDTIVYDSSRLLGKDVKKGQEISFFRAGGSAFAMFSTHSIHLEPKYKECSQLNMPVLIDVGESIANF